MVTVTGGSFRFDIGRRAAGVGGSFGLGGSFRFAVYTGSASTKDE